MNGRQSRGLHTLGKKCERVGASSYISPYGKTLRRGVSVKSNGMRSYINDEEKWGVDVFVSIQ